MTDQDQNIARLLLKKETPEPSDNLDEKIMSNINELLHKRSVSHRCLLLAWIFLALAAIAGIAMSVTLMTPEIKFLRSNIAENEVIIQILSALIILLIFDKLYRHTSEINKKAIF